MRKKASFKEGELFGTADEYLSCDTRKDTDGGGERAAYRLDGLFLRLSESKFRSSFHLSQHDKEYISAKGMDTIRRHAEDFIRTRLAPAVIPNDGKQTPFRGHPVFRAQHATGCCCRGCFEKWHNTPKGTPLSAERQQYAVEVLMEWIRREMV